MSEQPMMPVPRICKHCKHWEIRHLLFGFSSHECTALPPIQPLIMPEYGQLGVFRKQTVVTAVKVEYVALKTKAHDSCALWAWNQETKGEKADLEE